MRRYGAAPVRTEALGTTSKSLGELRAFLTTLSSRFSAATYDLLTNNCNHFSNEVRVAPTPFPPPWPQRVGNE